MKQIGEIGNRDGTISFLLVPWPSAKEIDERYENGDKEKVFEKIPDAILNIEYAEKEENKYWRGCFILARITDRRANVKQVFRCGEGGYSNYCYCWRLFRDLNWEIMSFNIDGYVLSYDYGFCEVDAINKIIYILDIKKEIGLSDEKEKLFNYERTARTIRKVYPEFTALNEKRLR